MTVLLLLAVLVLVLLNGFFVAAEFALVRVRRSRIEEEVEEGVKGARLVLTQLDDLSRYLAACQLGITLTSLGIGFLGEPAIASIFENLFGEDVPHWVSYGVSLGARLHHLDLAAHHDRRAGPEDLRDQQGRAGRALRIARPLQLFTTRLQPVHPPAQRGLQRHPARSSASRRPASSTRAARPRSSRS